LGEQGDLIEVGRDLLCFLVVGLVFELLYEGRCGIENERAFGREACAVSHSVKSHHLFHSSRFLGNVEDCGNAFVLECVEFDLCLLSDDVREERFECLALARHSVALECVSEVGIDTKEFDVFHILLDEGSELRVDCFIKEHDLDSLRFKHRNILRLERFVGGVVNLVLVRFLGSFEVFVDRLGITVGEGKQERLFRSVVELFILHAGILDKRSDVLPDRCVFLFVVVTKRAELIGNLLDDMRRDLGDVGVCLQIAS